MKHFIRRFQDVGLMLIRALITNIMKKQSATIALLAFILISCGGQHKKSSGYPENFKSIGDAGRVDYMIHNVSVDSVARFIIYGALGRNPDAPIDSLGIASNHAYEVLTGDSLVKFSTEYDNLVDALPLCDKMRLYKMAGSDDPQRFGYELGLSYMTSIRDKNLTVAQIESELNELRKACGNDTAMYRRFLIGFKTVLQHDQSTDVPEAVYRKFINYE